MAEFEIRVDGLNHASQVMRAIDRELQKGLRVELNVIAREVAMEAKKRVPQRSGRLAASIRPTSTVKEGRVSMGGARVPYAGFIEFGGKVGIRKSVRRAFVKKGRYLFPSLEAKRVEVRQLADGVVRRAVERGK